MIDIVAAITQTSYHTFTEQKINHRWNLRNRKFKWKLITKKGISQYKSRKRENAKVFHDSFFSVELKWSAAILLKNARIKNTTLY